MGILHRSLQSLKELRYRCMIVQQEVQIDLKSLPCITRQLECNFDDDKSKYIVFLFILSNLKDYGIVSSNVKHKCLDIWIKDVFHMTTFVALF